MFRLQRKHLLLLFPVAALAWQLLAVRAGDPLVPITLPGESKALDGRLKYARSLVLDKKWSDAIDTYAGILRDVGDKLIPVETPLDAVSSESRSLQVRRQCHLDIAALPKVALQKYRASVKFQTRGWLEAGIKNRDEEPLLRIVREAFCASEGDQALDFLGDLAFEKGEFHQALQWWLMLTMPATEVLGTKDTPPAKDKTPDGRLLFPNPQVDVARVRAKIIMAYLFDGNEFQAQAEFAAFEKLHADAAGHFAAEKGKYVAILKTWLDKGSPSFDRDLSWPTFAGDAARNAAGAKLPHKRLWAEGPTWSISLDDTPAGSAATSMPMAEKARRLACYPVITGERVLVHDGTSIQLIGLIGGQKLDSYALPKGLYTLPTKPNADKWLPRHTLTVAGKKAYAILGDAHHALAVNGIRPGRKNYLVCLDLAGNDATSLKPAWQILADAKDEEAAIFEGTPLVHEGRVYAILSRAKGLQVTARVVCLDADTGKQLWQEELARFTEAEDAVPVAVVDQPMLTLAGNQLVYCSQRGVIQALDARTGAQGWAVKYPSRGPVTIEGTPSPRDLSPCIYAEGRVHAAPMDTDRVLCLDAETGQVQWERDRIQVVHLVGCRYGKLLFTTADGLRVVDARTGSDKSGWLQPAAGRLPPLGRGVLLGGWLLWPTQDPKYSLRVVHHSDGNPHHDDLTFSPVQTRFIKPGNMAFANGCLVVAGNHELTGYVAPKHLLKKNEKDAAGPKPPPPALYRLAQSEADAGHLGAALKHFREAEKALTPKTWDQELLQWKCLVARQDLLLTAAREEKDTKKAVKWLEMATATEFPADMRLTAQVKIAERWQAAKEYEKAVSAYQAMLDDEKMRMAAIWYWPFGKTAATPWRGADIAQWRIYQSTYDHGQQIYRAIEEKAKHLASQAVGEKTIPVLEKLIQQYPSSQTVSKFWLNLAKAYEARKEFAAAINVYLLQRRHYVFFGDKQQVAEYVKESFALALTYEKEDCWEAARGIWEGLKTHSPDAAAPGIFPNQTVAQFVAQRIAQPEYNASKVEAEKDVQEPDLQLPLSTKWTTTATGLIIRGHANYWSKSHQWFFTGAGNDLSCRKVESGEIVWNKRLPFRPNWVVADRGSVLVAGPTGIASLRWNDAKVIWCWVTAPAGDAFENTAIFPCDPLSDITMPDTFSHFTYGSSPFGSISGLGGFSFRLNNRQTFSMTDESGAFSPVCSDDGIPLRLSDSEKAIYSDSTLGLAGWLEVTNAKDVTCYQQKVSFSNPVILKAWTYNPRLPTTLTGEWPRLFLDKSAVLALLPRNYGFDLERIDPKTGENVWKPAARLCEKAVAKDALAFHDKAVYYASGNVLYARKLDSGDLLWKQELPDAVRGWRVKATKQALVVYPGGQEEPEWRPVPFGKSVISVPLHKQAKYPFALRVQSYEDGKLLQQVQLEGDVTGAGVQFFPDMIVVTAGGKAWGLRGKAK